MSNKEIVAYLASSGDICGRLDLAQLNAINSKSANKYKLHLKAYLAVASLLFSTQAVRSEKKHQTLHQQFTRPVSDGIVLQQDTSGQYVVKGIVKDKYSVVPGAGITVKGKSIGAVSDIEGRFKLTEISLNDTLRISFIGYGTQEIRVADIANREQFEILMAEDLTMGHLENVFVGGITVRYSFVHRLWHKIKNLF
ncbi:carboxypeptidase-like regulatory domain-containing protein [Mucilaginibacter sp. CAU 1740]|uniref:carboxypeptidase-like regulatory domain-containing protein n=1 Tax=Mucilaginibacter sp. CAU 1740 TaxID=3140365 RepID=UPI00325C0A04